MRMNKTAPRVWRHRGGRTLVGVLAASLTLLLVTAGCGGIPDDGEPVPVPGKTPEPVIETLSPAVGQSSSASTAHRLSALSALSRQVWLSLL